MRTDVTIREAALTIGVGVRRLYQLIAEGKLKARKVGRDWLLTEREVDRFAKLDRPKGRPVGRKS
jgi:excisionase family DNA binding protein